MADKELLEALHEQSESMDRVAKAQWLMYMATQKQMEDRTPSSAVFGSYNFNPTSSGTQLAAWRQLVPRNTRRKKITFMANNKTFYLASSDIVLDINDLIKYENSGFNGSIPVIQNVFTPGLTLQLDTSDAIYAASLTGAGSAIELNAVINWVEEVYSNVSAIPVEMSNINPARPGITEKLTAGAMSLDGDIRATFTREGVR